MNIGICNLTIVPLRNTASHRSEMVSQLLFGERFEILDDQEEWIFVRLLDIPYEGWVQKGQFELISFDINSGYSGIPVQVVDIAGAEVWTDNGIFVSLLPGTLVPAIFTKCNAFTPYRIEGDLRSAVSIDFRSEIQKLIYFYRNSPYLWGGRSHLGIDCSGLTQAVYRHFGVMLPRDAYQQAEEGIVVDFLTEINPGDLAFFDNADGNITHVGVMIDKEHIMHASAKVRIDKMDSEGIFNKDINRYTHKLRIIKRYF